MALEPGTKVKFHWGPESNRQSGTGTVVDKSAVDGKALVAMDNKTWHDGPKNIILCDETWLEEVAPEKKEDKPAEPAEPAK